MRRLVIGVLLSGLLGCPEESTIGTNVIARLTATRGEVRSHPAIDPVWVAASSGHGLAAGDWVKTGPSGQAEITFGEGVAWTLEESSTVIIEKPKSEQALGVALQSGVVSGVMPQGDKPLSISGPAGKRVALRSKRGRARVRVSASKNGDIEVAAIEGSLDVSDEAGGVNRIEPGEVVGITKEAVKKQAPLPAAPTAAAGSSTNVKMGNAAKLRWQRFEGVEQYRVEWSDSPTFDKITGSSTTEGGEFDLPVDSEGTIYWRVAALSADERPGPWSDTQSIEVQGERRHLLKPENGATFMSRSAPRIEFQWKPLDGASKYELVVSRRANLTRPVLREQSTETGWTTRSLRRGRYYWGVFSVSAAGREKLFEKPFRLRVGRRPEIDGPAKVTF